MRAGPGQPVSSGLFRTKVVTDHRPNVSQARRFGWLRITPVLLLDRVHCPMEVFEVSLAAHGRHPATVGGASRQCQCQGTEQSGSKQP